MNKYLIKKGSLVVILLHFADLFLFIFWLTETDTLKHIALKY